MNVVFLAVSLVQIKIVRMVRISRKMRALVLNLIVLHRFVLHGVDDAVAEQILSFLEVLVQDQDLGEIPGLIATTIKRILIFSKLI